jgi:signal peptidase I
MLTEREDLGREATSRSAGRLVLWIVREMATTILPALFIALVINVFVAQATVVDGPSMQPTLTYNQRVIVEKITYQWRGPRRGDVIVFEVPHEEEPLIKRVVALPGETIEIRDEAIYVNGQQLSESWATQPGGPDYPATTLPPLHVFVLGDNRANSRDSRYFGPVSRDQIIGRARLIYWPVEALQAIR